MSAPKKRKKRRSPKNDPSNRRRQSTNIGPIWRELVATTVDRSVRTGAGRKKGDGPNSKSINLAGRGERDLCLYWRGFGKLRLRSKPARARRRWKVT
jgi:hypothetical protein